MISKTGYVRRTAAALLAVCILLALAQGATPLLLQGASAPVIYYHGRRNDKRIALTFDDGPHPRYTEEILGVLSAYHIRATFFFIGVNVERYPSAARAVFRAGHEIGNHTYSHPSMKQTNIQTVKEEIERTDRLIKDLGYGEVRLFRPPQGLYGEELPAFLRSTSKKAILWNIDTRDWEHPTCARILDNVERNLHGGDIILFHDFVSGQSNTVSAIKKLIPTLLERGYQFVTVSELIGDEKTETSG